MVSLRVIYGWFKSYLWLVLRVLSFVSFDNGNNNNNDILKPTSNIFNEIFKLSQIEYNKKRKLNFNNILTKNKNNNNNNNNFKRNLNELETIVSFIHDNNNRFGILLKEPFLFERIETITKI